MKQLFANIPSKTASEQEKLDAVLDQWDRIWGYSQYYVERLKTVELTLSGLEEVTVVVTEFEMKLASYDSMPSDMDNLRKAHDDLMTLEAEIQEKQVGVSFQLSTSAVQTHSILHPALTTNLSFRAVSL